MKKLTLIEQIERIHTITYGKPVDYKLYLNEDFKTQTQKYIQQGIDPVIVKQYLEDFKEIRDRKYREAKDTQLPGLNVPPGEPRFNVDNYKTFKELEIIVDYVAGQRKFGSQNFEDIKVDGKPIFENDNVKIYYADTPRACIHYTGEGNYSWCISKSDSSNMFYNYRLGENKSAIYFVKRKHATEQEEFSETFRDKYHFFVIQVINDSNISDENSENYIVTSAMNDGENHMSWKEILKISPELKGLQQIFEPKPLTFEEIKKIQLYGSGLSDEDFARLPYKEKEFYIDIYVKKNQPLTYEQFKILPEDLKNKYIGFGIELSSEQFELIKDNRNLLKRYIEITNRKFDNLIKTNVSDITDNQFEFVDKNKFDELNSDSLNELLTRVKEPDKIINILLSNENFINNLYSVEDLLLYINIFYSEPENLFNLLGQIEIDFINNLNDFEILDLLSNTKVPDKIINMLGQKGTNFINKLNSYNEYTLLSSTKVPDKIINILLSNENYINNLNSDKISFLFSKTKDRNRLEKILKQYGKS